MLYTILPALFYSFEAQILGTLKFMMLYIASFLERAGPGGGITPGLSPCNVYVARPVWLAPGQCQI